jgi:hypothetical protein
MNRMAVCREPSPRLDRIEVGQVQRPNRSGRTAALDQVTHVRGARTYVVNVSVFTACHRVTDDVRHFDHPYGRRIDGVLVMRPVQYFERRRAPKLAFSPRSFRSFY